MTVFVFGTLAHEKSRAFSMKKHADVVVPVSQTVEQSGCTDSLTETIYDEIVADADEKLRPSEYQRNFNINLF